MKRGIGLIILLITALSSAAQEIYLTFEGAQPKEKKYYFDIKKPNNFDISKYQYMIWKTLKDNGYELTDATNANIAITVNYMPIEKYHRTTETVKIGEKEGELLGQKVTLPIYSQRKSERFKKTHYQLDLIARKKGASENSLPIWHIYTPNQASDISRSMIVAIKYLWFNNGTNKIVLTPGKDNTYKKVKINKTKLSEQDLSLFNNINKDFTNISDAEEYNNQINAQ